MRISEKFNLGMTQYQLDFVDIDIDKDTLLFVDPFFLSIREDAWSIAASRTVHSYFQNIISLLHQGKIAQARSVFTHLNEPNETCFGMSKDAPHGRGAGKEDTQKIFDSIAKSNAVKTGVLEDLEDTRIFVPGVDKDKISDITTNIIRSHLIDYTQKQCKLWGIPLTSGVASGYLWDSKKRIWYSEHKEMLIIDNRRILLVPKAIVSYSNLHSAERYHRHFVLSFLQNEHLSINSLLVQTRTTKKGKITRFVTKKDLTEQVAPRDKEFLAEFTQKHPEVFRKFKETNRVEAQSLSNEEILTEFISKRDVALHMIELLNSIPPGNENATAYHRLCVAILEFLFYPNITNPTIEKELHAGRKRIDITFDNSARHGFFHRLHDVKKIQSQYIFVECKNYSKDINNPELDQLSGRFSVNRGKFGFLLNRDIKDENLLISRCQDTYKDDRGLIIPLFDKDLIHMLRIEAGELDGDIDIFLEDKARIIIVS